jgi:hypothetical protein
LLAAIEENDNVITLHPAALDRYRADIDPLAALLPRPDLAIGSELEDSIHMLISAIIIRAPANSEKLEMEMRGRLDELLQAPTFSRGDWLRGARQSSQGRLFNLGHYPCAFGAP